MACALMKPVVDGLEKELGQRLQVMHINAQDRDSFQVGYEMGFRITPSYALFDGDGEEVWRAQGMVDRASVLAALHPLLDES